MSNGGGVIIIRSVINQPGVTPEENTWLEQVAQEYEATQQCTRENAWRFCALVYRLLR
jgi:hypothetical protein